MHFSHTHQGPASKATKIAVVAALHLAIGSVLLQAMGPRVFNVPTPVDENWTVVPTKETPPTPPEPFRSEVLPRQMPTIVVPTIDFDIAPPPTDSTIKAVRPADGTTTLPPSIPGGCGGEGVAKPTILPPPAMRSAVLANASNCVTPDYPARAARIGETGTVTLALLVGANGAVINSRLLTSSGSRELDRAAQSALSSCAFQPAVEGGIAQEGWARISYVWTLD